MPRSWSDLPVCSLFVLLTSVACSSSVESTTTELVSDPALDGSIDSQGLIDLIGVEMEIGRTPSGLGQRGFLSFDATEVLPEDGEELVVVNATLSVYEANTNNDPFGDMGNATVSLVRYGESLESTFFDLPIEGEPVIAASGSRFLDVHQIDVTTLVRLAFDADDDRERIQFRFQMEGDTDTQDPTAFNAHWDIHTAEAEPPPEEVVPTLTVTVERDRLGG